MRRTAIAIILSTILLAGGIGRAQNANASAATKCQKQYALWRVLKRQLTEADVEIILTLCDTAMALLARKLLESICKWSFGGHRVPLFAIRIQPRSAQFSAMR